MRYTTIVLSQFYDEARYFFPYFFRLASVINWVLWYSLLYGLVGKIISKSNFLESVYLIFRESPHCNECVAYYICYSIEFIVIFFEYRLKTDILCIFLITVFINYIGHLWLKLSDGVVSKDILINYPTGEYLIYLLVSGAILLGCF